MMTTFYPPYNFGGDGIYVHRLSNELARRGHRVDVIHCEDAYTLLQSNGVAGEYPNHENVKVHKLKSAASFMSPLLTQQTGVPFFKGKKIKKLLDENQYDVIHFHNMSLIGITALRYGGAAVKLYTTHEHWLVCPMHVLWKFNREVCAKKSCTLCMLASGRPPQLWRHTGLMEKTLRHVDCFIAPSRFTLAKHLETLPDMPIRHIPYFLPKPKEAHEISAPAPPPAEVRPYFLYVGRLEKIKGVQNLIPVFQNRPEYDLLVAGDGEYRSELEELTGTARNIKFLGRLNYERLSELYRGAVAVIVPSICYETFGIIIIEAFSMKTPVIVNNLGALPEVVEDSNGGFIYNDLEDLALAVDKLAKETALRSELGMKGYKAYLKYWTEDVHILQYMNLIHEMQEKRINESNSAVCEYTFDMEFAE
jgi:glycosyltransferase involved in cell wall biosynthesis